MKKIIFLFLFVSFTTFSQKKEDVILISTNKKETKNLIIFSINGENFRYKKKEFSKKEVLLKRIKNKILTLKKLKNNTKMKLDKINSKSEFIPMHYETFHNIYVYNKKCNNTGFLYEVEWILKVETKEID